MNVEFVMHLPQRARECRRTALFHCHCGKEFVAVYGRVVAGYKKSCGCLVHSGDGQRLHGHRNSGKTTPEYVSWQAMRRRCENPKDKDYYRYGAKGIRVCREWLNDFEQFLADMGHRPKGHTLDRIDPTKGYSKDNCRWATLLVQAHNQRQHVLLQTPDGVMSVDQWASRIGISRGAAAMRLKRNKLDGCQKIAGGRAQ